MMQTAAIRVAVPGPSQDREPRLAAGSPARVGALLARLWRTDPRLTGTGLFLLVLLLPSIAGVWLDPRTVTGAPAWLKPAKFAASTGIYALTIAWVFSYLPTWPRMRRVVGSITTWVMLLEVAIIDLQAWRGVPSHFNVGTLMDAALFSIMGIAIVAQTVASVAVAVALWRQEFRDRALGWALRFGMTITVVGALVGGAMTTGPNARQLAEAPTTGRLMMAGAHTVGGPDGGPGLPATGWSTSHGDLRVPHFVGLHAVQVVPLFAVLLRRRRESEQVALTMAGAVAYAATFVALLVQALLGVPFLSMV